MQRTRLQKKQPRMNPAPRAEKNTATKQTACTAANRPEPQTQPRTTATGENPHDYKTSSPAGNQYRLQKPTQRQTKRLTRPQNAPNHKHSRVQLPLGKTHTTTKQSAPPETNTACKNPHSNKTNCLRLRKPPRKTTLATTALFIKHNLLKP